MLDTHKFVYCNNNASNISVNVIYYRFISLSHIHHTCIHFLSRSFSNTQSRTKTFSFFVCICFHLFIILHFNSRVANCWAHTSMTMKIIIHLSFHRGTQIYLRNALTFVQCVVFDWLPYVRRFVDETDHSVRRVLVATTCGHACRTYLLHTRIADMRSAHVCTMSASSNVCLFCTSILVCVCVMNDVWHMVIVGEIHWYIELT